MSIEKMCDEYRENKRLIDELQAMNDEIKAAIIAAMNGNDKLIAGNNKISNIVVTSVKFDSTAFKSVHPKLFKEYSRETSYKRFTIV